MPDRDRQLDQSERDFTAAVAAALTETADEFADAVLAATELVAARFSVGRVARMWQGRVTGLVRRLLGTAEEAAGAAAEDIGAALPDGWDDLPGRYDDGTLPDGIGQYVETTEHLLRAVGDRLAEGARAELAAGLDAGDDIEQLRARLQAAFARDGAQLGPGRERRIARTEASRAWNTATLVAAQAMTGPDQPVVKQWITRHDKRVRTAHDQADGQIRLLADPFTVGGIAMQTPGDPTAPAGLVINCRCRLAVAPEIRASAIESQARPAAALKKSRENDVEVDLTAASGPHTGAMIALMPSEEDAERLALADVGAEPAGELHLTLFYLGEGADWDDDHRADLIAGLRSRAADIGQALAGRAFGAAHWNTDGDDPCWVWSVGDDPDRPRDAPTLETARWAATYALEDMHRQPDLPTQHSPWQPHVAAAYSRNTALLTAMNRRLGPIQFDRIRLAFAGQYTDIALGTPETPTIGDEPTAMTDPEPGFGTRSWSTPGDAALAYENLETGDGRVLCPGALYWSGAGPWPLQHADQMFMGHQGAELAGAIQTLAREGHRITGTGVLYPARPAGADALMLLQEGAPLGVSVDLDDVTVEFVDRTTPAIDEDQVVLVASLPSASLLRLDDGSWMMTASTTRDWKASGTTLWNASSGAQFVTGPDGAVSASALRAAFAGTSVLTAAAGDPDDTGAGTVVHSESSGDLLMRVTRARLRGATLVSMPAHNDARIVLTEAPDPRDYDLAAAAGPSEAHLQVVNFVKSHSSPVGARLVARALGMKMETARGHLTRAAKAGRIVRLAPGLYVGPSSSAAADVTASLSGDHDRPVYADRERKWNATAAGKNVLEWATDGDTVNADMLGAAFLWRDNDADPATLDAYRLGFADVIDGDLWVVAEGVYAAADALDDTDLTDDDRNAVKARLEVLYRRLAEEFDDTTIVPPWMDEDGDGAEETASMRDLVASAWTAMRDLPPMPAAWFKEPTTAELPPGSGGVHYADGRIYGWVAQAGEPHAGYPGRNLTIESLGRLDLTHFLRAKFQLDDGSTVRAGAFTMNAPHHRDGAECESAACQFDDTRTVAGIVTVGQNAGGLWFSGAAGPWLSDWDRTVFKGCQPSYHMREGEGGRWQLRAVLTVPVPGHSSPLLATVVTERSNLALAASAAAAAPDVSGHRPDITSGMSEHETDTAGQTVADLPGQRPDSPPDSHLPDNGADAVASALLSSVPFLDVLLTAMDRRQEQRDTAAREEAERLAASVIAPARAGLTTGRTTTTEGIG